MHIVLISPEIAPAAKVGGMADVVQGLAWELAIRGHRVEVILPKYDCMRYDQIDELRGDFDDLVVPYGGGAVRCRVETGIVAGVRCFFVDADSREAFFNRGLIYGHDDDVSRFAFFSRAALEYLLQSGRNPDIIHCHDWQTGLVPVLLAETYKRLGMSHPRVCFTLHNLKHQGTTGLETLRHVGLDPAALVTPERLEDNGRPGVVNLLKAGIVYSNHVTTVSPTYAREIRETDLGHGLQPTLATHAGKLTGVLNGIDYGLWDPATDACLAAPYTLQTLDTKRVNKVALQERLQLQPSTAPLTSVVTRLDAQKGVPLIRHAIFYTLDLGGQFVLLGTSPDPAIQADFEQLRDHFAAHPDVHLELAFDGDLARQIYAGADTILVPSDFEPCGLTQLVAMRYGTVPVVRATGGLADTVFDADYGPGPYAARNGFRFEHRDRGAVESALRRAHGMFVGAPHFWRELQEHGMSADRSWNAPGQIYLDIYHHIRA